MERARTSGLAITSLVCGICSLVLVWVPGLGFLLGMLAVIFGVVAMSQTSKDPNLKGRGMAVAGLVCGIVGMVIWLIVFFWVGLIFWAA